MSTWKCNAFVAEMKTAEKDIPVYKICVVDTDTSTVYGATYRKFVYSKNGNRQDAPHRDFRMALDYSNLYIQDVYRSFGNNIKIYNGGYNYFLTGCDGTIMLIDKLLDRNQRLARCRFVIPKGINYYKDYKNDDYVSETVRFIGIIDFLRWTK